ncbi:MAG TPA: hypothetical protein VGA17_09385, partial [Nitrospiraceae bacterium]
MQADATLTQGSVPFADANGALAQDNANLFWDDATDRLGIGTNNPNVSLEVAGNIHVSGGDRTMYNRSNNALSLGTNNLERMRIFNDGRVKIGIYDGTPAQAHIERTDSTTTGYVYGTLSSMNFGGLTADHAAGANRLGVAGYIPVGSGITFDLGRVIGTAGWTENNSTNSLAIEGLHGLEGTTSNSQAATITDMYGAWLASTSTAGTITNLGGAYIDATASGGTVDSMAGIHIEDLDATGSSVTNRYGLRIEALTGSATNDYGIYQAGTGQDNVLAGQLQLGLEGGDGVLLLYSEQGTTDYSVTLQPHAAMTQAVTYTLPADDGGANDVLQTDGAGALSWVVQAGEASPWTDDGAVVRLDDGTDNVSIGTTSNLAKLGIDGDTDEVQLLVQGNATQTSNALVVFENSSGTDLMSVTGTGRAQFQTSTDSIQGFQILDADGGVAIVNVDTVNEWVGIGTTGPLAALHVVGNITSPGSGSNSEKFGFGATAGATNNSLAVGYNADASTNDDAVAVGYNATASGLQGATAVGAGASATGQQSTAVGQNASASVVRSIAIGQGASNAGNDSVAIGVNVTGAHSGVTIGNDSNGAQGAIVLGLNAAATTINQFVAGSSGEPTSNVYFGAGVATTDPSAYTIHGTGGSGTDNAGGALQLAGGQGTGTGAGGSIVFRTAPAGSTGSSPNSLVTRASIDSTGVLQLGASGVADGILRLYSEQGTTDYSVTLQPHAAMTQAVTYTLPADDGGVDYLLQSDGSGALSWVDPATVGSATAWDDISDPDNNGLTTITFDNGETTLFTSDLDGGSLLKLYSSGAANNDTVLLDLEFADQNDGNAIWIQGSDNNGDVQFRVKQEDAGGEAAVTIGTDAPFNADAALTILGRNRDIVVASYSDTASHKPDLYFKRYGGSEGAAAIIPAGANLATVGVATYDGDSLIGETGLRYELDGTPANNNIPTRIDFLTTPASSQSGQIRMTLDSSGELGIGTTTPSTVIEVVRDDASLSTVTDLMTLTHTTTGTAAAGIGAGLIFQIENDLGTTAQRGSLDLVLTDATDTSEDADLVVSLAKAGTVSEMLRLTSLGALNVGAAGTDGSVVLYSEQGTTDYSVTFQPNAA